jgi:pantoate--beta-alanine ligase
MLLSSAERKQALALSRTLFEAKKMKETHTVNEIKTFVTDQLQSAPGVETDYFEIIDGSTLLPATSWNSNDDVIGCVAARVGKIRLIDNINFSS